MPSSCLPQMCAELTVTHERANARENKEIRVWRMVRLVRYHRYVLNELVQLRTGVSRDPLNAKGEWSNNISSIMFHKGPRPSLPTCGN